MYHAARKVEFQPFNRWYSQLTFFFSFWTACDTPSIEVETTEQQVARHDQPNIYIPGTQQIDNKTLYPHVTSGETFNTIYTLTQVRKIKITRYPVLWKC